jgi:hypothetical protein
MYNPLAGCCVRHDADLEHATFRPYTGWEEDLAWRGDVNQPLIEECIRHRVLAPFKCALRCQRSSPVHRKHRRCTGIGPTCRNPQHKENPQHSVCDTSIISRECVICYDSFKHINHFTCCRQPVCTACHVKAALSGDDLAPKQARCPCCRAAGYAVRVRHSCRQALCEVR